MLESLGPDVTQSDVEGWLEERDELEGWEDIGAFQGALDKDTYNGGYVSTQSECFQLSVTVEFGTSRLSMYSLIDRAGQVDQILTRLRGFGVY